MHTVVRREHSVVSSYIQSSFWSFTGVLVETSRMSACRNAEIYSRDLCWEWRRSRPGELKARVSLMSRFPRKPESSLKWRTTTQQWPMRQSQNLRNKSITSSPRADLLSRLASSSRRRPNLLIKVFILYSSAKYCGDRSDQLVITYCNFPVGYSRLNRVDDIKICTTEQRKLAVTEMHQRTQR